MLNQVFVKPMSWRCQYIYI